MVKQWELPEGVDLATVTAYAEEMERKRHRDWSRKNPEKVEQQRIRTYRNFLIRRGYKVLPPEEGACLE